MPKLIDTFKKQGGMKLIRQYAVSGSLFTAVCEFMILGKSKTALEILRLSAEMKTKRKLIKKYGHILDDFDREYNASAPKTQSNKVWVCWFQGLDQAPPVVRACFASLTENLRNKDIVLITSDNMFEYAEFPEHIIDKWEKGIITHTHMTDLLRLELLTRHGGTWIDATVLCTRNISEIPDYYFNSELFLFQSLKPGRDGQSAYISSWYMNACMNNRILMAARKLCYEYWKKNNDMMDYYLLHHFIVIAMERYEDESRKIVPVSNSTPHILLLHLFDKYDEKMYYHMIDQIPFHKLSYKFSDEQLRTEGTYYEKIMERFGGDAEN